jgi:hypothetical protein
MYGAHIRARNIKIAYLIAARGLREWRKGKAGVFGCFLTPRASIKSTGRENSAPSGWPQIASAAQTSNTFVCESLGGEARAQLRPQSIRTPLNCNRTQCDCLEAEVRLDDLCGQIAALGRR